MKSIVLPAGATHVLFGELAHRIADAMHPDTGPDDNRLRYTITVTKIKAELIRAVNSGALAVKDKDTLGEHTFPMGDALNRAFVSVDDLREFVAGRGLSVLFQFTVNEDGGSTTFRATQEEYDAMAAGKQAQRDERHKRGHYSMYEAAEVLAAANSIGGAEAFLKNRMCPAVESGALVLLDPIDGGPVTGRLCRPHDDWVTPKAIDEWLAGAGFVYRWPVTPTATQAAPVEDETTEQRRARWLDWYGKGERGAVQKVYMRERLTNPKADRSFIGKEIEKAKQEKAKAKQGGAMFGQLVQDGKRIN